MAENAPPLLPPEIAGPSQKLVRGMGLVQSTAVNMLEMIGIGPFITIGVILSAMGGPQAVLGWFHHDPGIFQNFVRGPRGGEFL